jgi:dienelactone hydrolase
MRNTFLLSSGIFFLFIVFGCGTGNSRTKDSVKDQKFETGKVISSVTCRDHYDVSYALYLPKRYTPGLKYPVIIAFDPHAGGSLPLVKYKELADKYGYILMGSNDSKNGQDMNTSGTIIDALFNETSRFSINPSRIYVMGFSGGARIASMIGLYNGGVAGVIGCGAGFISTDQQTRFKPDYISFVGTSDFNMNELIDLDKKLDEEKFTHASILFNGKHDWPPANVMENAFIWNEFCAMRKNIIPKNDSMVNTYVHSQKEIVERDIIAHDEMSAHNHLTNLLRFVNGLAATGDLSKNLMHVDDSPTYKTQKKQLEKLINKEMSEQQYLNAMFLKNDLSWWKSKIANYDRRISKGKDSTDVRMCKRLKSYLSLISYMNYTRDMSANDTVAAKHSMGIYEIVDPENAALTKADKVK